MMGRRKKTTSAMPAIVIKNPTDGSNGSKSE